MIIFMRTTLVLDDELVRDARRRAMEAGITLSEAVNRALRASMQAPAPPQAPPFRMPTFRGRATRREIPPHEIARLRDDDLSPL